MDKGYEKEEFKSLSIKKSVLQKFRRFSKRFGRSQSMTLLAMLEFFDGHGISPDQQLGETIASLKHLMKRRFNAMVAIIRSIEKEQTLPTVGMLQALFGQGDSSSDLDDGFDLVEKKYPEAEQAGDLLLETTVPLVRYERLEERLEALRSDFQYVLDHVRTVKGNFGKGYLKVDLQPEEIENYKRKLQKT